LIYDLKEKDMEIDKIERFWNWFKVNNQKFLFLNQIDSREVKDKLLDEFLLELHKYCDKLFFEIGGQPEDKNVELIISAEGNADFFGYVEKLVDSAPEIKSWEVIAFKPPMGKGFKTNYRGKEFDPSRIIFIPLNHEDDPKLVGLQVCYPDYLDAERDIFINGTYIAIDSLIGEKSTALDINYLDVARTPENIADYDFKHLEDIREYIDEKKNAS
jgi:hypothetical protein